MQDQMEILQLYRGIDLHESFKCSLFFHLSHTRTHTNETFFFPLFLTLFTELLFSRLLFLLGCFVAAAVIVVYIYFFLLPLERKRNTKTNIHLLIYGKITTEN